jgi:O-antigen/teichoic acid export membrane protein
VDLPRQRRPVPARGAGPARRGRRRQRRPRRASRRDAGGRRADHLPHCDRGAGHDQADLGRLRRALEEGASLQVLAGAIAFGGFALVSQDAIPLLFGREWVQAAELYPYLAAAALLFSSSAIVSALLVVRKEEPSIAFAAAVTLVMAVALTFALVPHLGAAGYGAGRVLGFAVSAYLLDRALRRSVSFSYRRALPWFVVGMGLVLSASLEPHWRGSAALVACLVLVLPGPRREAVGLVRAVAGKRRPGS